MRDALILELTPGEAFYQESTVVLLRGKLLMTGRADTVPLQQLPGQLLASVTVQMPTAAQVHRYTHVALFTVLMPTAAQLDRQTDEDDRRQRQALVANWPDIWHLQQLLY